MEISIRKAGKQDKADLESLMHEFDKFDLAGCGSKEKFASTSEIKAIVENAIFSKGRIVYLAKTEGKSIGYISAVKCKEQKLYIILDLFVKERYYKMRIGGNLLKKVEEIAKKDKYGMKLEVYEWNTSAINFYKRCGYKSDGVVMIKGPQPK